MVTKKAVGTKKTARAKKSDAVEPEIVAKPRSSRKPKTAKAAVAEEPKAKNAATRKPRAKKVVVPEIETVEPQAAPDATLEFFSNAASVAAAAQLEVELTAELAPEALIVEFEGGAVGFSIPQGMENVVLFGAEPTDEPPEPKHEPGAPTADDPPAQKKQAVLYHPTLTEPVIATPAKKNAEAFCAVHHAPVHCHTAADEGFVDTSTYLFVFPDEDPMVRVALMQVAIEFGLDGERFDTSPFNDYYVFLSTNPKEQRRAEIGLAHLLEQVCGKDTIVLIAAQNDGRTIEETRRALQWAKRVVEPLPLYRDKEQRQPVALLSVLLKQDGDVGAYRPELCV